MKNGSTFGLILTGTVVVIGGALAGYYYIGGSSKTPQAQPTTSVTDVRDEAPTAPAPAPRRKVAAAGEYTAPGAPQIQILETRVALTPKKPATPPPADPEASETGVAPDQTAVPSAVPPDTSGATSATDPSTDPNASKLAHPNQADSQNPTQSDNGDGTLVPPPPPPPAPVASAGDDQSQSAASLFHVQAGVFQNEKNARILEDTLKHRGYAAMTLKSSDGDHDTFVVQVGAFKSKVTADEVAGELTTNGFPASVAKGQ